MIRKYAFKAIAIFLFYVVGCSTVDRFSNPSLSDTELFLRLPQVLVWNFENNTNK